MIDSTTMDPRLWVWREAHYAERLQARQNSWLHRASCRIGLPQPRIELLWTDRPDVPPDVDWWDFHQAWGLDFEAEMGWCRGVSLLRVVWPEPARLPPLMLVLVVSIEVQDHQLQMVARHRRDLRDYPMLILVCGVGFSDELAARGGPTAVARAGAHYVEKPRDWDSAENAAQWKDYAAVTAALQAWVDGHQDAHSGQNKPPPANPPANPGKCPESGEKRHPAGSNTP